MEFNPPVVKDMVCFATYIQVCLQRKLDGLEEEPCPCGASCRLARAKRGAPRMFTLALRGPVAYVGPVYMGGTEASMQVTPAN